MFLNKYIEHYVDKRQHERTIGLYGVILFYILLFLCIPVLYFIPKKYWAVILIIIILVYSLYLKYQPMQETWIADGGKTLIVQNNSPLTPPRQTRFPYTLFGDMVGAGILSLVEKPDPYFKTSKKLSCTTINQCSHRLCMRMFSPHPRFPRRQIIITNHTSSAIRDSFAFFPLIPMTSKIVVVQHNFNGFISYISKNFWGAWTIDKDDKTPEGKKKLNNELQKIVEYMKTEDDLTVVIYPQGRVPKTTEDCRKVNKMYPGAFYMSLMTRYPITTLVNDYSRGGVFSMIVKEPVHLYDEYKSHVNNYNEVESFRNDPTNKEVLDEICDRFKNIYQEEYDLITKTESWMNKSLKE